MLTLCTPGVEDAELVCDLGLLGHRCDDRGCEVVALSPMLGCPLSPWFGYEWLRTEFLFVFSGAKSMRDLCELTNHVDAGAHRERIAHRDAQG